MQENSNWKLGAETLNSWKEVTDQQAERVSGGSCGGGIGILTGADAGAKYPVSGFMKFSDGTALQ